MDDFLRKGANTVKRNTKRAVNLVLKFIPGGFFIKIFLPIIIVVVIFLISATYIMVQKLGDDIKTAFAGAFPGSYSKENSGTSANGAKIYYQGDYNEYGINYSGCGMTSFAMLATAYGVNVTPVDVAKYGIECGGYSTGAGMSWSFPASAKEHFQVPGTLIETEDINQVVSELGNGNMVMSSQGAGIFTSRRTYNTFGRVV